MVFFSCTGEQGIFRVIRAENVTKIFGPDPASAMPLLEQGKTKDEIREATGQTVGVNNASFDIQPGEVFAIMGLSGCGKSTLIRCVNRIIEPTAGSVFFKDPDLGEQDLTKLNAEQLLALRKRRMSMVFQHFALLPHRTVLSNVAFGLEIQGRSKDEREHLGQRVLDMVGLGQWGQAYPSELSGGMQQRVGLARALATEAEVLLMDEPFSALDPLIKFDMQRELVKIQRELHRTILFITHDLDEAMRIGDHIAIMEAGRIVQIGSPEQILVNPRTEYVANFVEHADPTSVITAGTIALPFDSELFVKVGERNGIQYLHRHDHPEIHYGHDRDGYLREVRIDDREIPVQPLDEILDARNGDSVPGSRTEVTVTCGEDAVLRQVLRSRLYSTLPVIVTRADGRVRGLIDDPELINGILEKRGYTP
jgi:glycine betaine/proline transport system ATP-binding protein